MGGGASPLNTGGGMGGQNQTFGTLGGFGGNLGTAGTLGGQQNNVPQFAQNYLQNQQPALTMMPQNQGPYTGPTDPSAVLNRAGNMGDFFQQQQQMGQQPMGPQMQPTSYAQAMAQNTGGQQPTMSYQQATAHPHAQLLHQMPQQQQQQPQQQPDMSTAIGQLKGGDQFAAQNTMRQLVGLPPLQAPAYNANPTMSDVQKLLQSGDKASAQEMMQRMVGLPTSRPAPAIQAPPQQQPLGIQSLMQARPPRRRFGRM
jgi:hypothetical protein